MSKELGIPQNTQQAIELLTSEVVEIVAMDMGLVNEEPFIIRVNMGIMAAMVLEADREHKSTAFFVMQYLVSVYESKKGVVKHFSFELFTEAEDFFASCLQQSLKEPVEIWFKLKAGISEAYLLNHYKVIQRKHYSQLKKELLFITSFGSNNLQM